YTSGRRDRLLEAPEGDGPFAPTFIEKLQQAPSDNRILHELFNMRCTSRADNLHPLSQTSLRVKLRRVERLQREKSPTAKHSLAGQTRLEAKVRKNGLISR